MNLDPMVVLVVQFCLYVCQSCSVLLLMASRGDAGGSIMLCLVSDITIMGGVEQQATTTTSYLSYCCQHSDGNTALDTFWAFGIWFSTASRL